MSARRAARRWMSLVALVPAIAGIAVSSPGAAAAPASAHTALGSEAPPRLPRGTTATGLLPDSTSVTGAVVLNPRNGAALHSFLDGLSNRSSPLYHDYLRPASFGRLFGPSSETLSDVRAALVSEGLSVGPVSSDGLLMPFSGSAGTVEQAFHTGLARYRLSDGAIGQATTSGIAIPSSIAGSVASVIGLDDLVAAEPASGGPIAGTARRPQVPEVRPNISHPAGAPVPCATASTAAQEFNGLTDDELANAYGTSGLYASDDTGAGQRVALFELEPFSLPDIRTFDTCYFGAEAAGQMVRHVKVVPVDGGQPAGYGSGEALLDVENVSAMAPSAAIDVYEAPNTSFGLVDDYAAIVDDDADDIVTTTWGMCEQAVQLSEPGVQQAESLLFQQAAAQGQTVLSAAGDEGSDDCDAYGAPPSPGDGQNPLSVDDPSSQPYVVAVGGTSTEAATDPPLQEAWNEGGAGGGGISGSWSMPSWQRGSQVPGIALPGSPDYRHANAIESEFGYPTGFCQQSTLGPTSTPCRLLPDVSAQADPYSGALTIYSKAFIDYGTAGWITLGGTSSAAPTWAAMLALVDASPACASNPSTVHGVGFVSPLLYDVASDPTTYAASFDDVTSGNNDIFDLDNGQVFPATPGFDLATGLGTPQLTGPDGSPGLAADLCAAAASPESVTVTGVDPAVLPTSGGRATITGTGFQSGDVDEVADVTVGTWTIPRRDFAVRSATEIIATFPPASATVPPGAPPPQDGTGSVDVTLTLRNGASSAPGPGAVVRYVDGSATGAQPSIAAVSPYGGSERNPAPVTIVGSGFENASGVTFGGVTAPSFTVESPSRIEVTPPPFGSQDCAPSVTGQIPDH